MGSVPIEPAGRAVARGGEGRTYSLLSEVVRLRVDEPIGVVVDRGVILCTPLIGDDEAGWLLLITAGSVAARVRVVGGAGRPRATANRAASLIYEVVRKLSTDR